jgi:hypothetical protein
VPVIEIFPGVVPLSLRGLYMNPAVIIAKTMRIRMNIIDFFIRYII